VDGRAAAGMKPIRVGVVCDFREEGWHSMDLIADMLLEMLPLVSPGTIEATRLQPAMPRRFGRLPLIGGSSRAHLADRITGRFRDYPRWLKSRSGDFDIFHIVDHSYGHLVNILPAERTVVTCNDVDAILPILPPHKKGFDITRSLARRILDGLGQAERIACISHATERRLLESGRVIPERVKVVYLGVHPTCSPRPDARWDAQAERRLGPKRVELLHVGSTIPRKRIDALLRILRGVLDGRPDVRLLRVGEPFTAEQESLARALGVTDAIVHLPFLERAELAAVYRRAALVLLPSEREGFGLPLAEAMACGTPVVASAIPSLLEVGGPAVTYCAPEDLDAWVTAVRLFLHQREEEPAAWEIRRQQSLQSAARFDWRVYAADMTRMYQAVCAS
jgi:glycosyltransferase involved in cell wall biosynthesis